MFRPLMRILVCALGLASPVQAAFHDNGDGTITDTVTGLMWDRCAFGQTGNDCSGNGNAYTWPQALALPATANAMHGGTGYKGHHDWRLPNIKELESLVSLTNYKPAIDGAFFPNAMTSPTTGSFWSSTIHAADRGKAWAVDFYNGITTTPPIHEPWFPTWARLVRGGHSPAAKDALPDISVPLITGLTIRRYIENMTWSGVVLTSNEDVWSSWMVVPAGAPAPTAAEIMGEATYGGMRVDKGDGQLSAGVPREFRIDHERLSGHASYDVYAVVQDGSNNRSEVSKVSFAAVPMHRLIASANPPAGGTATCTPSLVGQDADASTVESECTYTVNPGYTFTGWSGDCLGLEPCVFSTVTEDKAVTANFSFNYYPIEATAAPAAGGEVNCAPNPAGHGSDVSCSFITKPGYYFTGWSGACSGETCALAAVKAATSVTANFAAFPYSVTASADPPVGGGDVRCEPEIVHYDDDSTCTAPASPGYFFIGWSGACAGQGQTCHLTDIHGDVGSVAYFAPQFSAGPLNDTGLDRCYEGTALAGCTAANTGDAAPHPR